MIIVCFLLQMNWRLREGQGEAIYEIGVEDSGRLQGLPKEDMAASLKTLKEMAKKLGATVSVLRESTISGERDAETKTVTEVLIRKIPDVQPSSELRVAVMGNENAGKSTLLGVLTQGELDDGRGRARLNMFRHLHEVQSGRTSSISHEIVGFDSQVKISQMSQEFLERLNYGFDHFCVAGSHYQLPGRQSRNYL